MSKNMAVTCGINKNCDDNSFEHEVQWNPSCHQYRPWGFDLTALSGGRKRGVDGRRVIGSGELSRFSTDLLRIAKEKSWQELNEVIAKRWRERTRTGTGVFRFALPEISNPGRLVIIELGIEWGSTLPFANRTLTSIVAYERRQSIVMRILHALHIRRAA